MKIYVYEDTQDVRIDFGGEEYARTTVIQATGDVFTEVASTIWLPDVLGGSELVYETPAPPLEWPTKPNALVVADDVFGRTEKYIHDGKYWVDVTSGDPELEEDLELKRIIFEGEDNG